MLLNQPLGGPSVSVIPRPPVLGADPSHCTGKLLELLPNCILECSFLLRGFTFYLFLFYLFLGAGF